MCRAAGKLPVWNNDTKQWDCVESKYYTAALAKQDTGAGEWWSSQPTGTKAGLVIGGLAVLGVVGFFVYDTFFSAPPMKAKANRRRRARRNGAKRLPAGYRMKTALAPGWVVAQDRQGMYVVLNLNSHTKRWDELEWANTFDKARSLGLRRVQRSEGRGAAWGEPSRHRSNRRRARRHGRS